MYASTEWASAFAAYDWIEMVWRGNVMWWRKTNIFNVKHETLVQNLYSDEEAMSEIWIVTFFIFQNIFSLCTIFVVYMLL